MASLSTQTQEPRRERCLARVLGGRMSNEPRIIPGRCSGSRWPSWPLCLCALLLALMSATSAEATQYSASGTIGPVRTHTLVYGVSALQDVSVFQVSSGLGNGCSWLYISASDANSLAVLVAAKVSGESVVVWYDNTVTSPWGDPTICAAQAIQQN